MESPEPDSAARPRAPAPLDLVQAFVNTRAITADNPYAREDLSSPEALDTWWRAHRPGSPPLHATAADLQDALVLREGLRALLTRNNNASQDEDAAAVVRLEALAHTLRLRATFTTSELLTPAETAPARAALADLLGSTVAARADGTWPRLKACRDPVCREAFYDTSKNRSATWCSMQVCGARAKQRAFVTRRRQQRGQAITST